jgi:hypothetical protein
MRRDRIMECTIATIAGIGLAAGLTASLGVRSSGPPTPLKAEKSAAKPVIAAAEVPRKQAARKRPARKHHRRHHRRAQAHAPAPPSSPPRIVAQAPSVVTPSPARARPIRIQPVSAPAPKPVPKPAPKPAPAKPSPPKPSGVSFDDSG